MLSLAGVEFLVVVVVVVCKVIIISNTTAGKAVLICIEVVVGVLTITEHS